MIMQKGRTSSQPARDTERQLEKRLEQFDVWAASAEHMEDGWEGQFPLWLELDRAAEQVMAEKLQTKHSLYLLGQCWAITEEEETCADWAREHLQEEHVQEMVRQLATDPDPRTRWQACDVLGGLSPLDAATLNVLENAFQDADPYVRRRAFLALTRHVGGVDPQPYVRQMLSDTDSYNRYVAIGWFSDYTPLELQDHVPASLQDQIQVAAQDPEVAQLLAAK